jgi:hypothetical protein
MTTAEIKPHDVTGNVILKPAEPPISPWPIITPEARDGWDALQRELATGYAGDSALLGRWYIDGWERTFQATAPEWVTRTVPVIAPREAPAEPAPVAAAPEPAGSDSEDSNYRCPDCGRESCTGEECYWPDEAGIERPEAGEDVSPQPPEAAEPAPDATQVLNPGEAMTALLPPVEAPTAMLPAVQDEDTDGDS